MTVRGRTARGYGGVPRAVLGPGCRGAAVHPAGGHPGGKGGGDCLPAWHWGPGPAWRSGAGLCGPYYGGGVPNRSPPPPAGSPRVGGGGGWVVPGKCSPPAPNRLPVSVLGCVARLAAAGDGVPDAMLEGQGPRLAATTVWFPCVSSPGCAAPARRPGSGVGARGGCSPSCSLTCECRGGGGGCAAGWPCVPHAATCPGAGCREPSSSGLPSILGRWVRPGGLVVSGSVFVAVRACVLRAGGAPRAWGYPSLACSRPPRPIKVRFSRGVPPLHVLACGRLGGGGGGQLQLWGSLHAGVAPRVAGLCLPPPFDIRGSVHRAPGHHLELWPRVPLSPASLLLWGLAHCGAARWGGGGAGRLGVPYVAMLYPSPSPYRVPAAVVAPNGHTGHGPIGAPPPHMSCARTGGGGGC